MTSSATAVSPRRKTLDSFDIRQITEPGDPFYGGCPDVDVAIRILRPRVLAGEISAQQAAEALHPYVYALAFAWYSKHGSSDMELNHREWNRIADHGLTCGLADFDWTSTGGKNWWVRRFGFSRRQVRLGGIPAVTSASGDASTVLGGATTNDQYDEGLPALFAAGAAELEASLAQWEDKQVATETPVRKPTMPAIQRRTEVIALVTAGIDTPPSEVSRKSADDAVQNLKSQPVEVARMIAAVADGEPCPPLWAEVLPFATHLSPDETQRLAANFVFLDSHYGDMAVLVATSVRAVLNSRRTK